MRLIWTKAKPTPLTNWHTENTMSWRAAPTFSIDESLTWQRGTHSLNFGGGFLHVSAWENAQQFVPGIQLGFNQNNDPAAGLFVAANFAGANATQLTAARDLYGLLTGRVTSVTGQAALDADTNKYIAFAPRRRAGYVNMYSMFLQDSWRATSTLTLNAGLRWDAQLPFTAVNDVMSSATMASVCGMSGVGDGGTFSRCNFGRPGAAANAAVPEYVQLSSGTRGYDIDWNNVSPNAGVAWRPNVQDGFMRTILGDPEQATVRAGYSIAYDRQGLDQFTGVFGPNPGSTLSLTRDESTGLVPPGESWPVLLSQRNRLYNAPFPESPTYPIVPRPGRADDMRAFAPDIQIGMAQTWTVSFQRSITRDMAVDIRYVGTRGSNQWSTINYNQRQNRRQRVRQRVQAGPGRTWSPTTRQESRTGADRLRTSALAPAPCRCQSISRTSAGAGMSPIRRPTRAGRRPGRTPASRRTWFRPGQSVPRRRPISMATSRAGTTRQPPVCRQTSSSSTQPSARERHRQRRLQRLPRAADRPAPPPLAGPLGRTSTTSTRSRAGPRSTASTMAVRCGIRQTSATPSRRSSTGRFRWDAGSVTALHERAARRHHRRLERQRRRPRAGSRGQLSATCVSSA